jgi:hypothetical protein
MFENIELHRKRELETVDANESSADQDDQIICDEESLAAI